MVRVAGLHDQVDAGHRRPAARTAARRARRSTRSRERDRASSTERQTRCLERELRPGAGRARHPDRRRRRRRPTSEREALDERFRRQIFPVLTPLAVGLGRPFPYISNLSLSLARARARPADRQRDLRAREGAEGDAAALRPGRRRARRSSPLEELIAEHLDALFPGMEIVDYDVFRVTRDADFTVSDEADDLLQAVEDELRRRRFGEVVRVEVDAGMSARAARAAHRRRSRSRSDEVFDVDGPARPQRPVADRRAAGLRRAARPAVDAGDPAAPAGRRRRAAPTCFAVDAPGRHPRPPPLRLVRDLGRALRRAGGRRPRRARDQADRVPHERRLAARAGADPRGRARQAGGLPGRAQGALRRAREHPAGRARWRRRACTSSTACPALKTHAKCILVVRREGDGVRHYVHVGTGNYHPKTARLYTDFGLFTCDERDRRRRRRHVQLPHRLRAPARATARCSSRPTHLRDGDHRRDRAHDRRARRRAGRRGSR